MEVATLTALAKKQDQCKALEKKIAELRTLYLPILEKDLGAKQARLEFAVLTDLVIRALLSKPFPPGFKGPGGTNGTYSEEKIKVLMKMWAKKIDEVHPSLGFSALTGLQEIIVEDEGEAKQPSVDLRLLKTRVSDEMSGTVPPAPPKFSRGDLVTVAIRMTWDIPTPANEKYRKNITVGTEGVI